MSEKTYIVSMEKGVPIEDRVAPCWTLLDIGSKGLADHLTYYRSLYPDRAIGFAYSSSANWIKTWIIK